MKPGGRYRRKPRCRVCERKPVGVLRKTKCDDCARSLAAAALNRRKDAPHGRGEALGGELREPQIPEMTTRASLELPLFGPLSAADAERVALFDAEGQCDT